MKRGQFFTAAAASGAVFGTPGISLAVSPANAQQSSAPSEYQDFAELLTFLRARNTEQYAVAPPNGIYEESYVPVGGIEQWVTIHGADRDNPVLLFLHGGPGDVTNPWTFVLFGPWEKHFTVVQWDQRGAGKTLRKSGPGVAPTITVDRMVRDGVELAAYLCAHLGKKHIVIVGHSFGTIIGLGMARMSPATFTAYVGTGQVADETKNYSAAYDALIAYARDIRNQEAVADLLRVGSPPYASNEGYSVQRKWSNFFEGADEFLPGMIGLTLVAPGGSMQAFNDSVAGQALSADQLVPQTRSSTAQQLGLDFQIPMFVIQGERDFTTPTALARHYVESIKAPLKSFVTIPNGGHFSVFMHSDAFLQAMLKLVD